MFWLCGYANTYTCCALSCVEHMFTKKTSFDDTLLCWTPLYTDTPYNSMLLYACIYNTHLSDQTTTHCYLLGGTHLYNDIEQWYYIHKGHLFCQNHSCNDTCRTRCTDWYMLYGTHLYIDTLLGVSALEHIRHTWHECAKCAECVLPHRMHVCAYTCCTPQVLIVWHMYVSSQCNAMWSTI